MKKKFIMTAVAAGMIAGSSFGAVSGDYCHSAEYYRKTRKPVAPVTGVSEKERIAAMELETAQLTLQAAKISAGVASDESQDAAKRRAKANIITKGESVSQVKEKAKKGLYACGF